MPVSLLDKHENISGNLIIDNKTVNINYDNLYLPLIIKQILQKDVKCSLSMKIRSFYLCANFPKILELHSATDREIINNLDEYWNFINDLLKILRIEFEYKDDYDFIVKLVYETSLYEDDYTIMSICLDLKSLLFLIDQFKNFEKEYFSFREKCNKFKIELPMLKYTLRFNDNPSSAKITINDVYSIYDLAKYLELIQSDFDSDVSTII